MASSDLRLSFSDIGYNFHLHRASTQKGEVSYGVYFGAAPLDHEDYHIYMGEREVRFIIAALQVMLGENT